MAQTVTIGEAKTHFSKLVRRAEAGEGFGSMKGEIRISPDFGAPLEELAEHER